jgi:hypothetical protein
MSWNVLLMKTRTVFQLIAIKIPRPTNLQSAGDRSSGDAPAQIDGLELKSADQIVLLQPGKHVTLKNIALFLSDR